MKIFWYIWMLPQNLLGLCVKYLFKTTYLSKYMECDLYTIICSFIPGVSLGKYIFVNWRTRRGYFHFTVRHEYGHYLQGKIFGPLYLLVIGLPSVINNLRARIDNHVAVTYYDRYPEKWANELGSKKVGKCTWES